MDHKPDMFTRAMIEIHNDIQKTRTNIQIDIDKDDPDPALTVGTVINSVLNNPTRVQVTTEPLENPHAVDPALLRTGNEAPRNSTSPLHMPDNMPYDDRLSCRAVFEMLNSHLDLARSEDGYNRLVYVQPHVWSEFLGWCQAIHVVNTMTKDKKAHELAEGLGIIKGPPKRGETAAVFHIDDSGYQPAPKSNVVEIGTVTNMTNEQIFNAGQRIDKSEGVDLSNVIGEVPPPADLGDAMKQANEFWPGQWATIRNAAKIIIEKMGLTYWSLNEIKEGIYADPSGSYIDRMDLIKWFEERLASAFLNATPTGDGKFRVGQFVEHYKGGQYFIIASANDLYLEESGKNAYAYIDKDSKVWLREEGSFEADAQHNVPRFKTIPITNVDPALIETVREYAVSNATAGIVSAQVFDPTAFQV